MMRIAFVSVAAMLLVACQPSVPKITGAEAETVLAECVFFDSLTAEDNFALRSNGGIYTPAMISNLSGAASACKKVGNIDTRGMDKQARACLTMFAARGEVFEVKKSVIVNKLTPTPAPTSLQKASLKRILTRLERSREECNAIS